MKTFSVCFLCAWSLWAARAGELLPVGVAQVDITPDYPVRLSGFGFRRTESEGVNLKIWAKALAFNDDKNGPAIIVTADNLCVSDEITAEVAQRLAGKIGLKRERFSFSTTHTHTAPMLRGVCPTLFSVPIPPEHQAHIDRYTREFIDHVEQVALAAFKDIRPAQISWGIGRADLAVNRRTQGGPVDHDLPTLAVRDPNGKMRAIYFSYACHCVTMSDNRINGDWAGYAQKHVQEFFPGAVALASVGCGADSNPSSGVIGANTTLCDDQGRQIAEEVKRVIAESLTPVTAMPEIKYARRDLPLAEARTRAEWEERAKRNDAIGHHARGNIERLNRGETLPTQLNYPIQTWVFGGQLAMVFLPGETVVDYSLRLKGEFDRSRLWINGYSNDGRCYIPSERVLKEGGYEGGDAMVYYDSPQIFAPGLEQIIIETVAAQLPAAFKTPRKTATAETTPAKSVTPATGYETLRDAPSIARFILDSKNSETARDAAIQANPQLTAPLVHHLARGIESSAEEYARIPWIWRVAIACGKRNDTRQITAVLDGALPAITEPLRDWQAVVIGGGIINGLSLRDVWPSDGIEEILNQNTGLKERWARALEFARSMAANASIPTGTRYDALRMIALEPWEKSGEELARHLVSGADAELQMGAVSGLVDMKSPKATDALLAALSRLEPRNRELAIHGLMRSQERMIAALKAIEKGEVAPDIFNVEQTVILKNHPDPQIRARAEQLLK